MKTIYSIALQTANYCGYQHEILPNTTLNEFYGIGNATPPSNPIMDYFIIGLKLENLLTNGTDANGNPIEDGVFNLNRNLHKSKDGNVFFPLPFRLVKRDLALSRDEATDYRLKKEITINGEQYLAYYLKKLMGNTRDRYLDTLTDKMNDTSISIFNSEDATILNPIPQTDEFVLADEIKALAYTKPVKMSLTQIELANMEEAVGLLYGTSRPKVIGEICLCSGRDMVVNISDVEASGVQANMFIEVDIDISTAKVEGLVVTTEVGGAELMTSVGL